MERRDDKRRARRVPVRFWKRGEEKPKTGFTTNISHGGMFIGSNSVHGRGTRLRIEVVDPLNGFLVEGVVARAIRSQLHMQQFRASGMGIRFLKVSELVEELFPPSSQISGSSTGSRASSSPVAPSGLSPSPSTPPQHQPTPKAPSPSPQAPVPESGLTPFAYGLQYRSREELRASFERDIRQGGLFITTPTPAPLQEVVVIEIQIQGLSVAPVRLRAKVVHRVDPQGQGETNLLAGMGLELLDPSQAQEAIQQLLS